MNNLGSKHVVLLVLAFLGTITSGIVSSASVAGKVSSVWTFLGLSVCVLILQVAVVFLWKTDDEKDLQALRLRQRLDLDGRATTLAAIDNRMKTEIASGDLENVVEWSKLRKELRP